MSDPASPGDAMLAALAEPHRTRVRELLGEREDDSAHAVEPPAEALPRLDALLGVLAERHRQEIVRLLEHDQLTQRQLMARVGLSQPLLSHHLKALREAGLVEKTVCDRVHVYRLRAVTLQGRAERPTAMAANAPATGRAPPC